MKAPIITQSNTVQGSVELPAQFNEAIRPDLILRAVISLESRARQSYGSHPGAGNRASAKLSRRRRDFKASYGMGISRVPRKTMSRNGTRMNWVGAQAPGTRKGRQAHPPKACKNWVKHINVKENRKAIRSALSAVMDKALVSKRGHHAPATYPFVVESSFEKLDSTSDVVKALHTLGFDRELERAASPRINSGRARMRGRHYRTPRSILIVPSAPCTLSKAGRNIPGIEIAPVHSLSASALAPGGVPGRITLFTHAAIERLVKERLYL